MSDYKTFHYCTSVRNDTLKEVVIGNDNWATGVEEPDLQFPIYKPCCHFYELNLKTGEMQEIDCKDKMPSLCITQN